MAKYIYKHKRTGKLVFSDRPLPNFNLILVTQIKQGAINKHDNILTK